MKKILIVFILCFPLFISAQTDTRKGIKWTTGLSWEQIKKKAKFENKYIFVDCYATWCKPCKEMDKIVYSNDTVGYSLNSGFISVKVQMDTGRNDNNNTQILYAAAREFEKKYTIIGLPTFLFFSSNGDLVHKEIGGQSVQEFIQLTKNAVDTNSQLYTLFARAISGSLSGNVMPRLIQKLKDYQENSSAHAVAKIYVNNYLEKFDDNKFYTKETLQEYAKYLMDVGSKTKGFKFCFNEPSRADQIAGRKGYAADLVNYIITKEEINPLIDESDNEGKTPVWKVIRKKIKSKYGRYYASLNVLNSKIHWSQYKKQWDLYSKLLMRKWPIYRTEFLKYGSLGLNEHAWNICLHSKDKKVLNVAVQWATLAVDMGGDHPIAQLDTKANILYKLGRKKEAVETELMVVDLLKKQLDNEPGNAKFLIGLIESFQRRVDKMKNGEQIVYKN